MYIDQIKRIFLAMVRAPYHHESNDKQLDICFLVKISSGKLKQKLSVIFFKQDMQLILIDHTVNVPLIKKN